MYINVNEYTNKNSDWEMIQSALDDANKKGKAVIIPKFNERTKSCVWNIDKTILLDDDAVLILQNCHLRLTDGSICNMFANRNARDSDCLTKEKAQNNIHIMGIGKAVCDGGIHNKLYEDNGITRKVMKKSDHHITENCMFFFQNVHHVVIENITIKNQRYWGIYFFASSNGRISNIHLESASNVPNQDGVDLGKGCHDFIIENITGCTGDNVVALNVTDNEIYGDVVGEKSDGDIRNVIIRNLLVYGVGGCAIIRLLNHDGYKIYNITIDNVVEVSPWSENDATVAQNPDLIIKTDDEGNLLPVRTIIPGEIGYRTDAAIIIGESYWYAKEKAKHGDTFGITVSNVATHSRMAVAINNTLMDSSFNNIRVFGNGYMAAYMGEGTVENVCFNNISYDKTAKPLKDDENIFVEWNNTKTEGYHYVYFNGTGVKNVTFNGLKVNDSEVKTVFGGFGSGAVKVVNSDLADHILTAAKNIDVKCV